MKPELKVVSCLSVKLGEVVRSRAGRDSGKEFVVVKIVDALYVLISDGTLRRIEKPKKKKIKHLEFNGEIIDSLSKKLCEEQKITNAEIKKALVLRRIKNKTLV